MKIGTYLLLNKFKWTLSLNQVILKNVRFKYNDEFRGMNVFATLKKSEFSVDEIDPGKSVYAVNDMLVEGLTAKVQATKSENIQMNQPGDMLQIVK